MIGRIVVTSVPQGLDGGTGFQPVLRTQGLRPSVAERLAMRAAYPHPFPFGDPRNPHVLFHRIESVGDRTIHVLGSIRDAGASYTGRSNHLAELIAIDPSETRGLPGGPAFAARSFQWLGHWAGSPREVLLAAEPAVPANDPADPEATGRPARCTAWERATGDAGWAGELAQSFLDGRRALIWAGENVDVLELFVEASRLLPASARWQLTFNTCEIEPFPAHWRAVRPALGLVGNYEPKNELRLVLGKLHESRSRAPDHNLARLARGETPTPRPPQPISGHGGTPTSPLTSTAPDDVALRAQLKEISDERRRRLGTDHVARGPSDGRGRGSLLATTLLLGSVVFLGSVAFHVVTSTVMIQHPVAIARWLGDRANQNTGDSRDVDLRTPQQQQERNASQRDAETQANKIADARRQEKDKREQDEKSHRDKINAEQEVARMEAARTAAEKTTKENNASKEQLAAQQKALKSLGSKPELTVQLLDVGSDAPRLGVSDDDTQEVLLHDDFEIEHLIDPSFEFVSPCDEMERLLVTEETTSLANTRTWLVRGKIHNTNSDWQPDAEVCRIVARENKLRLKPLVKPPNELFGRLQNSLLLVSTRDPVSPDAKSQDGPLIQRCRIVMAAPVTAGEPYLLDPLAKDDELPVDINGDLKQRLAGIDPKRLEWSIELTHPALDAPRFLSHHKKDRLVLHLANPPKGDITVTYHRIEQDGSMVKEHVPLKLDAEVDFFGVASEAKQRCDPMFVVKVSFEGFAEPENKAITLWTKVISAERLRNARDTKAWESIKLALKKKLVDQKDPFLKDREATLTRLKTQLGNIPRPGSPGRAGITEDNVEAYNRDCDTKQNEILNQEQLIKTHTSKKQTEFANDTNNAVTKLIAEVSCFLPIEAQIKRFDAIAYDSKGTEYRIPIVKAAAD